MTVDQFTAQLRRLEEAFGGRKYPAEMHRILFRRLHATPLKILDQAFEQLIVEEKFQPRWKEIHGAIALASAAHGAPSPSRRPAEIECHVCEDTGIKLRQRRSDLLRDFYCNCEVAREFTKFDWTVPEWAATITGFEHIPPGKERRDVRFDAARVALAMEEAKKKAEGRKRGIVDMTTGRSISIFGEQTEADLAKLGALRAQLAARAQPQADDEVPF